MNADKIAIFLFFWLPASLSIVIPVCALLKSRAHAKEAERERAALETSKALKLKADQERAGAAEAERARIEAEKLEKAEKKHAEKVRKATELADLAERRLKAEKELKEIQTRKNHFTPEQNAAPEPDKEKEFPEPVPFEKLIEQTRPRLFAGKTVAFTGKIPGMTHGEAASRVRAFGGKAYEKSMPANTNLLVVGDKPGYRGKLEKADKWIATVDKITANEFLKMISA